MSTIHIVDCCQSTLKVNGKSAMRFVLMDGNSEEIILIWYSNSAEGAMVFLSVYWKATGMPDGLIADKGFLNIHCDHPWLKGIKTICEQVTSPRSKGFVERNQELIENKFESYQRDTTNFVSINLAVHSWMIGFKENLKS